MESLVTRHGWTRLVPILARHRSVLDLSTSEGWKADLPLVLVIPRWFTVCLQKITHPSSNLNQWPCDTSALTCMQLHYRVLYCMINRPTVSGNSLAESSHARLLPCSQFFSFTARRHARWRHRLPRLHLGMIQLF